MAFVSPHFHKCIKLDKNFTKNGDKGTDIAIYGAVGHVDSTPLIVVPTGLLPLGVNFIITHPSAMVSPVKISDYKQHDKPQGINGWLVEGRIYFDAFVLNNKRWAIYVSRSNVYDITFTVSDVGGVLQDASIYVAGSYYTTDTAGTAKASLQNGIHEYTVILEDYKTAMGTITVASKVQNIAVKLEDDLDAGVY